MTRNAARALGLNDRGTLEVGKRADLALWRIGRPAELSYWLGGNPCVGAIRRGESVTLAEAADGAGVPVLGRRNAAPGQRADMSARTSPRIWQRI